MSLITGIELQRALRLNFKSASNKGVWTIQHEKNILCVTGEKECPKGLIDTIPLNTESPLKSTSLETIRESFEILGFHERMPIPLRGGMAYLFWSATNLEQDPADETPLQHQYKGDNRERIVRPSQLGTFKEVFTAIKNHGSPLIVCEPDGTPSVYIFSGDMRTIFRRYQRDRGVLGLEEMKAAEWKSFCKQFGVLNLVDQRPALSVHGGQASHYERFVALSAELIPLLGRLLVKMPHYPGNKKAMEQDPPDYSKG
jgi:hypothetical protein